jgi:hypothetical protein
VIAWAALAVNLVTLAACALELLWTRQAREEARKARQS